MQLGKFRFILGAVKNVDVHLEGIKNLGSETIKLL